MSNAKESVALSSIAAGGGLTLTKLVVGLATGSIGIISEAAHSLLDLAAAIMTWFAVHHGDQPADDRHQYGHGKIESLSALIETGLLFVTSAWIVWEAGKRLLHGGVEVEATWYAFAVIIGSIIVDISRSRALNKVAKRTHSQALEADALHFSSDIWSSTVVLLGLVGVRYGIEGADAVAAIGVSLFVALAGWRLGQRTIDVLIDAAPRGVSDMARLAAEGVEGVIRVERLRVRPLGPNVHIEMAVQVNRKHSLARAHEIVREVEAAVEKRVPGSDAVIHARSVQLDNETVVETVRTLAAKHDLAVHDVIVDDLEGRRHVSYDLEVPDDLTVGGAHDLASHFEEAVKAEVGDDIEVNSHIEPLKKEAILSSNVTADEMDEVLSAMRGSDQEVTEISDPHSILVRKIGDKFFVSLHCLAPAELSIEVVHNAASRLEYLMKEKMRRIKRVVIHVEPKKEGGTAHPS